MRFDFLLAYSIWNSRSPSIVYVLHRSKIPSPLPLCNSQQLISIRKTFPALLFGALNLSGFILFLFQLIKPLFDRRKQTLYSFREPNFAVVM